MTVKRVKGDRQGQARDKENAGGMRRKNKEFSKQQLRVEGRRGRKTQRWMRQGSHRIAKGKEFFLLLLLLFFEVRRSNLSFVPVIVQHLPQLISVKVPPFFLSSSHSHPPSLQRDITADQLGFFHAGPRSSSSSEILHIFTSFLSVFNQLSFIC